jgi:hypothetical protein
MEPYDSNIDTYQVICRWVGNMDKYPCISLQGAFF